MITSVDRLLISALGYFTLTAFAALLIAAISHPALAQATTAPQPAGASSSQIATLRTTVRRVSVDVVVTDAKGRPVTGLAQEDFQVEEDNAPQPIRSFKVYKVDTETPYTAPKIPPLPANTFLNIAKAPEFGTPTVILYDALNMSLPERNHAHQELVQFVRNRRPGTQIAIFVLGAKLHLLQGFTEDTDLLSAALQTKTSNTHAMNYHSPGSFTMPTPGAMDGDPTFDQILLHFQMADMEAQGALLPERWEITINALTEVGRFLKSVPGRKNLVWISSTFFANIFGSDGARESGELDRKRFAEVKQAKDILSLSHTAIYPLDIRGVRVSPIFNAAPNTSLGFPGKNFAIAQIMFRGEDQATRVAMDSMADDTGGHAFYGTNGLREAVSSAIANGSTYYAMTYEPTTNPKYDGSLRHTKITLKKSGYNLSYRRTYYADDLDAAARNVADAPQNPLTPSLERGTPLSRDLFIEAHLEAVGSPVPATPAQMQVLSQYEAMQLTKTAVKTTKANIAIANTAKQAPTAPITLPVLLSAAKDPRIPPVMMQQYFISYGLIARQLEMPADDTGAHQASLELGVISYDEDGRKLNGLDTHIDDTIPAPRYAKLASDGYHVIQSIVVPITAASIRLAVRDIRGNRIGSLEVQLPLAKTAEAAAQQIKPLAK